MCRCPLSRRAAGERVGVRSVVFSLWILPAEWICLYWDPARPGPELPPPRIHSFRAVPRHGMEVRGEETNSAVQYPWVSLPCVESRLAYIWQRLVAFARCRRTYWRGIYNQYHVWYHFSVRHQVWDGSTSRWSRAWGYTWRFCIRKGSGFKTATLFFRELGELIVFFLQMRGFSSTCRKSAGIFPIAFPLFSPACSKLHGHE